MKNVVNKFTHLPWLCIVLVGIIMVYAIHMQKTKEETYESRPLQAIKLIRLFRNKCPYGSGYICYWACKIWYQYNGGGDMREGFMFVQTSTGRKASCTGHTFLQAKYLMNQMANKLAYLVAFGPDYNSAGLSRCVTQTVTFG